MIIEKQPPVKSGRNMHKIVSERNKDRILSSYSFEKYDLFNLFNNRNNDLFEKTQRELIKYARYQLSLDREASEDIVSDAFIELLSKEQSFQNLDHVVRWLKVVMKHNFLDRIRLKKQWKFRADLEEYHGVEENFVEQKERFEGELEEAKQLHQVLHEIRTLKGRFIDVFYLYFIKNKSVAEIADYYNLSKQTVRNHKTYAIGILKQRVHPYSEEYSSGNAIFIRSFQSKLIQICVDDIIYIQGQGKNCMIITQTGCLTGVPSLANIASLLSTKEFVQIHPSFIVSRKWVTELSIYFVVVAGKELPVGLNYRNNLDELFRFVNGDNSKEIEISEARYRSNRLPYDNILYVKGDYPHSIVATIDGTYPVHPPFQKVVSLLPRRNFVRIHKSYVVNINRLTRHNDEYAIVDGVELPVGRTFRGNLEEAVEKMAKLM